ncbi:hypothetical protein [Rhizobium sp. G21]|uniref:hypothetical protein n=1 Tax=Rhizobium sp. G21 TaxID=2758439 RepID=UPI0016028B9C|nr:hypothetical protein [Rhizobium sp. G21]MBB1251614.1 hypothetical protein [Rhizobium sp. G21]
MAALVGRPQAMEFTSERRLCLSQALHLGSRDDHLRLGDVELGLDLATLGAIHSVAQLGPQFFDLNFKFLGHLRLLDVCER